MEKRGKRGGEGRGGEGRREENVCVSVYASACPGLVHCAVFFSSALSWGPLLSALSLPPGHLYAEHFGQVSLGTFC